MTPAQKLLESTDRALDRACYELVDKDTEIARLRTALTAIKAICQTPQHQRPLYHVELIAVTTLGK